MALHVINPSMAPQGAIRGVLFDLDGLVLDTEKLYSRFSMGACRHFGFPMTYEQSLHMRALNGDAGQHMLWQFFGPEADYKAIRAERIRQMNAFVSENGVEVKPGIVDFLRALKELGIGTAIVSASPMDRIESYLSSVGLLSMFDHLCSGYDVPNGKPAPDIYCYGAARLGLEPGQCLALEDSYSGLLSASRAGCVPILIPDLDPPNEKTLPLIYAVADNAMDVLPLVK